MSDDATRHVCVVLHDVAPSTRAACRRTLEAVAQVAKLPATLLVVPRYHGDGDDADFDEWLRHRARRGDELALHGLTHRDEQPLRGLVDRLRRRHYTRSEGEFWALDEAEAAARIADGLAWFRARGFVPHGFVAPAWLLGEGAWAALVRQPFEYTATLRHLWHLPGRQAVTSQSVVYSTSSGWRRQTSIAWNAGVARLERGNPLLRLELHPRDADFAGVRRSWQRILERALHDRTPVTVADFMRRSRAETAPNSTLWQSTQKL